MPTFDEVREERKHNKERMTALSAVIMKLIDCDLGDEPDEAVDRIREIMGGDINPVDCYDALVSASDACKVQARRLELLAESLLILLKDSDVIEEIPIH